PPVPTEYSPGSLARLARVADTIVARVHLTAALVASVLVPVARRERIKRRTLAHRAPVIKPPHALHSTQQSDSLTRIIHAHTVQPVRDIAISAQRPRLSQLSENRCPRRIRVKLPTNTGPLPIVTPERSPGSANRLPVEQVVIPVATKDGQPVMRSKPDTRRCRRLVAHVYPFPQRPHIGPR